MTDKISPLILLAEEDNVLVCRFPVRAGQPLVIDGGTVTADADIDTGHKLARRALAAGEIVYKYGAPIGSMIKDVAAGGHVHLHNMKSNYIASHTRQTVSEDGK
jgi:(2R)-sulfolactate sulfo-lyase subunit alpha